MTPSHRRCTRWRGDDVNSSRLDFVSPPQPPPQLPAFSAPPPSGWRDAREQTGSYATTAAADAGGRSMHTSPVNIFHQCRRPSPRARDLTLRFLSSSRQDWDLSLSPCEWACWTAVKVVIIIIIIIEIFVTRLLQLKTNTSATCATVKWIKSDCACLINIVC